MSEKPSSRHPNESTEYRAKRAALLHAEVGLRDRTEAVAAPRRDLPCGGLIPTDCAYYEGGADLGDGGITATLDGAVAIPEWDPETGAVVIEPSRPLAAGSHTLEVVASDRVGNRAERRFAFPIP